jgi:hypothetical protein
MLLEFFYILFSISCLFLLIFNSRYSKIISLIFSIGYFFLSLLIFFKLDFLQYLFVFSYIKFFFINFIGYDTFSIIYILLTTLIFPLIILSS